MDKHKRFTLVLSALGVLILILDGKTAVSGIQSGLSMCLQTLIPGLFPFLFLSSVLTASLSGNQVSFLAPLEKLCRIPASGSSVLLIGWLGGFPVGARAASDLYKKQILTIPDASRLAVFCNNAGPAFLFGVISSFFPNRKTVFALWIIQLMSGILAGLILPSGKTDSVVTQPPSNVSLQTILQHSLKSMGCICGWVVLFRMVLEFLDRWLLWLLPGEAQVLLVGILELSNGCLMLSRIPRAEIRFILASMMLSFGGFCILLQTRSVFPEINMLLYLKGKLLQMLFSFLLSVLIISLHRKAFILAGCCVVLPLIWICVLSSAYAGKKEVAI